MAAYLQIVLLFIATGYSTPEKFYIKEYYETGILKAEGWQTGEARQDYWKYYFPNGEISRKGHYRDNEMHGYWYFYAEKQRLVKEGHFNSGVAEKWWIFYEGPTSVKVQYNNGKKVGFAYCYKNDKLEKVEKYSDDRKLGEWTDLYNFKRDNPEVKF